MRKQKIKDVEQLIINYLDDSTECNYKQKASEELTKVLKKIKPDDLMNIGFILDDYPDKDHLSFKLSGEKFFLKMGFYKDYLKALNKKEIHSLAKAIYSLLKQFNLSIDKREGKNEKK